MADERDTMIASFQYRLKIAQAALDGRYADAEQAAKEYGEHCKASLAPPAKTGLKITTTTGEEIIVPLNGKQVATVVEV